MESEMGPLSSSGTTSHRLLIGLVTRHYRSISHCFCSASDVPDGQTDTDGIGLASNGI